MKFKFIEHTADIGVEAHGKDLREAFENAALGFNEIMTETSKVKPSVKRMIVAVGEDYESLLYDFLEKFLIFHDSENLVFSKIKITRFKEFELEAEIYGEKFNPKKHKDKTSIKAITYHNMKIGKTFVSFIVDI